jgi:hypothetical protein
MRRLPEAFATLRLGQMTLATPVVAAAVELPDWNASCGKDLSVEV